MCIDRDEDERETGEHPSAREELSCAFIPSWGLANAVPSIQQKLVLLIAERSGRSREPLVVAK